jgi:hypothetical protein
VLAARSERLDLVGDVVDVCLKSLAFVRLCFQCVFLFTALFERCLLPGDFLFQRRPSLVRFLGREFSSSTFSVSSARFSSASARSSRDSLSVDSSEDSSCSSGCFSWRCCWIAVRRFLWSLTV